MAATPATGASLGGVTGRSCGGIQPSRPLVPRPSPDQVRLLLRCPVRGRRAGSGVAAAVAGNAGACVRVRWEARIGFVGRCDGAAVVQSHAVWAASREGWLGAVPSGSGVPTPRTSRAVHIACWCGELMLWLSWLSQPCADEGHSAGRSVPRELREQELHRVRNVPSVSTTPRPPHNAPPRSTPTLTLTWRGRPAAASSWCRTW